MMQPWDMVVHNRKHGQEIQMVTGARHPPLGRLALVKMRVANTSSTAGAIGRDICDDARRLRDLSDV